MAQKEVNITLTEVLARIKTIDSRVEKLRKGTFITYTSNGSVQGYVSVDAAKKDIQSRLDQLLALMHERKILKAKLAAANAATEISVAGEKMSIAEALERRKLVSQELAFVDVLKNQYGKALVQQNRFNERVEEIVERRTSEIFSNVKKVDQDAIDLIRKQVMASNTFDMVDPVNLEHFSEALDHQTSAFDSQVDTALSIANATNTITLVFEVPDAPEQSQE